MCWSLNIILIRLLIYGKHMNTRFKKIYKILESNNLDAVALIPGSNFKYLTGGSFPLMERPTVLIITKDKNVAILPSLEVDSFNLLKLNANVISWHDKEGFNQAFKEASKILGNIKNIGVEGQIIRFFETQAFKENFKEIEIINSHKEISSIRISKEENEINFLIEAIKISEKTLENTLNYIKIGMQELQIKQFLIQELYKNGAEGLSFDPIVLTGKNSAIPHGHSSNQNTIKHGDALLFDFGAAVKGYKADITRTFFMIETDEYQRKAYETVKQANEIGIQKSKIPNTMHDVDNETSLILESSDYKEFIVHKTGHGLGLDVHEDPYIVRGNKTSLEEGMVITVEPGLYIPEKFGIRIEDDVLITNDQPKVLTSFSKELRIINNE